MVDGFGGATTSITSSNHSKSTERANQGKHPAVLIVDSTVEESAILLDGLVPGTQVVRAEEGKLEDVAKSLEALAPVGAVHILAHGQPGAFNLAGERIDGAHLSVPSSFTDALQSAVSAGSQIALWACSVGKGSMGARFVDQLSRLTQATVTAASRLVGDAASGGTWDIGAESPFSARAMATYPHTLPSAGTVDFGTGISVLVSDGDGPATNVLSSGLDFTYSGNTDAIDIIIATPSAGYSNSSDPEYGSGTAWDGQAMLFSHLVGQGEGLVGTANVINYASIISNDDSAFDLDGFVLFYRGDNALSFDITAHDSSGTQIGSAVTIASGDFAANTDGASNEFTVGFTTINDATLGSDFDNIVEFRIAPSDPNAIALIGVDNIVIDTAVVNNLPELGGTPADDTATEDVATAVDLSAYNVSDGDGDTITLTLAVDRGTIASTDGNGTTSGVTVATSGTTSMTLQGTAANLNTYLNDTSKITFTTDSNDTTSATLTVTPNDGTADGTADTVTISISAVNDDPSISGLVTDITFTEDTAGNVDLSASALADVDSGSVTVTITASEGTFSTPVDGAGVGSGVTETLVNSTTITLVGSATDINTYLDTASNIQWTPVTDDNGNDTSTFTITANDGDGSGDVALGTVNADVTAVNDDPTISGLVSDITVTEETAGNIDLSAADFSDVDSTGTVFVTLTASEGTLASSSGGGVTVSGSGTAALTLSGTFDNIETFLDTTNAVQYTGATDDSGDNAATLTVEANDDDGSGDVSLGTVNLDITNVNDDPSISGLVTDITFTEDTVGNVDLSASALADVDSSSVTVTITASEGTFSTPVDGAGVGSGVTETLVNSTTITLVGSATDINTYLDTASNIQWTPVTDDNGNDTSTFTITANDGDGSGDVALGTVNADVTAVNDDPTATGGPTDISVLEESAGNVDLSGLDFSDVDSAGTVFVTLTASEGTLASSSGGGVTVSGSGTAALTLSGTFDNIETFLDTTNAVQYTGATDDSGDNAATLTVEANDDDGSGDVTLLTANFDITDINDEPTLTATGSNPTFTEEGSAQDLFNTVSASTVESGQTFSSLTLTVTNVSDGSDENLSIDGTTVELTDSNSGTTATNTLSYSVSLSGGTATITLTGGTMSAASLQTLVDGLAYENTSDNPTTASNRVVTITSLTDSGGTANSGDDTASLSLASTVAITGINDAPVIGSVAGETSSLVTGCGDQDVSLFDDATVTNIDSSDHNGGFITISQNTGTANGSWTVDGTNVTSGGDASVSASETIQVGGVTIGTVDVTDDGQGGNDFTINFTTNATSANIQTLLQNLGYNPPSGVGDRTFTVTLNDNDGTANGGDEDTTASFTITVASQPPTATGIPTDVTVTEDTASDLDLSTITFSDPDTTDGTVTITASEGTMAASSGGGVTVGGSGTGTLTLDGNLDDINIFLDTTSNIQYTGANNDAGDNAATLTFDIDDGSGAGDVTVGTANIDITEVNDAATFGGDLSADVSETNDTVGGTATTSDIDGSNTFNADTVEGTYGDLIIAANGDWTYDLDEGDATVDALNAGDTLQDTITVEAADGTEQDIIITINGNNDAAVIGGDTTGSIGEDTDSIGGTVTATDVDNSDDTFTATTVNGTYGDLTIAANGDWVYDLDEANGDVQALAEADTLQDTVSVQSEDGTSQDIVITITGVNDAATFGGNLSVSVNEDATYSIGDTATVSDVDGADTFTADTLSGSYGDLTIAANGDWSYDIDETDSTVQALAAGDTLGDTITVEADDGTEQDISITITGVNDLPTSSGGSVSTREDRSKTFTQNDFNFSDVDDGDALVSVRIDTLPTFGTLKLSGVDVTAGDVIAAGDIGNLTFTPPNNQSETTSFTYSVNDGTGFSAATATMSVRTTSVNDTPSDISLSGASVTENAKGAVIGTITVSDVDDDEHTLTVSDSRFTITEDGELKLKSGQSIDFETEETVTVTITATDDQDGTRSEDFTITVTDIAEFTGGDDDETVDGSDNDDFVMSFGGNDRVTSGNGRDTIDGGDGDDTIDGGDDDDLLRGGTGNDNVAGGLGDDLVFAGRGDLGNDMVSGGDGLDSLGGGFGDDLLQGEDNDDLLWGRFGADTVEGGTGNDMLYNGQGEDTVYGGAGDDTLWAGNDDDVLSGGDGDDVFIFGATSGNDTILDFNTAEDQINFQFNGAGFSTVADVQAAASLVTQNGQSGVLISWDDGNQSAFIVGITLGDLTDIDFVL